MSGLISTTRNAHNYTTSFSCKQLASNELPEVNAVFFYDLAYQGELNTSLELIESKLLYEVASTFGLVDGSRCVNPPTDTIWLTSISSSQPDAVDTDYPGCLDLAARVGERCVVVRGEMNATVVSNASAYSFIVTSIAQAMRSGAVTEGTSERVAFLGTSLDKSGVGGSDGGDALPAAISSNQSDKSGGRSVTILGGFLVAGFCFVLLGVLYFLYQRRKRYVTARDVELALSKSDSMAEKDAEGHTLQQDAMSEDMADVHDASHSENGSNGSHAQDLSQSLRNEMMGVHAREKVFTNSSIPREMDEFSDAGSGSDADSWAQTDGTIGSLELQLDPITAEV